MLSILSSNNFLRVYFKVVMKKTIYVYQCTEVQTNVQMYIVQTNGLKSKKLGKHRNLVIETQIGFRRKQILISIIFTHQVSLR